LVGERADGGSKRGEKGNREKGFRSKGDRRGPPHRRSERKAGKTRRNVPTLKKKNSGSTVVKTDPRKENLLAERENQRKREQKGERDPSEKNSGGKGQRPGAVGELENNKGTWNFLPKNTRSMVVLSPGETTTSLWSERKGHRR